MPTSFPNHGGVSADQHRSLLLFEEIRSGLGLDSRQAAFSLSLPMQFFQLTGGFRREAALPRKPYGLVICRVETRELFLDVSRKAVPGRYRRREDVEDFRLDAAVRLVGASFNSEYNPSGR